MSADQTALKDSAARMAGSLATEAAAHAVTRQELDAAQDKLAQADAARVAALAQADAANTAAAQAKAQREAFAARFDALYGEVETGSGISRCPGYLTVDDKQHFDTLREARLHQGHAVATEIAALTRAGQPVSPALADLAAARFKAITE